jgi:DNA-binding LacI/PurR family transcriptional regulator
VPKPPRVEHGRQSAKVSIHDVAREARVSTATVSNVYNRPEVVAEQTRLGRAGRRRCRVCPGQRGPGDAWAANPVGGCILLDVADPFYAEVRRGIEDGLRPRGFLALIGSSDVDSDREREYVELMRSQRVRGIILNPTESGLAALSRFRAGDPPIVLVDHPQNGNDLCAVTANHELGGYLLARHLIELGHRTLTLVSPPAAGEGVRLRLRTCR